MENLKKIIFTLNMHARVNKDEAPQTYQLLRYLNRVKLFAESSPEEIQLLKSGEKIDKHERNFNR